MTNASCELDHMILHKFLQCLMSQIRNYVTNKNGVIIRGTRVLLAMEDSRISEDFSEQAEGNQRPQAGRAI